MQNNKNRFAGGDFGDDSDDDSKLQKVVTKTQKKKEERKITDKPLKVNNNKMAEGGFEVVAQTSSAPQRGGRGGGDRGRGGRGGGDRGGRGRGGERGGRGDGKPRGDRPRTALKVDAEGNPVVEKFRGDKKKFEGKPREEGHPYDRRSGTGRGRRPEQKRDGHGKSNWGDKPEVTYKQKGAEAGSEAKPTEGAPEEEKKEEPEEEKVELVTEILGVSLDDFKQGVKGLAKKEGRKADVIKEKVQENATTKEKQSTLQKKDLSAVATVGDKEGVQLFGFSGAPEDEDAPNRGGRAGGRGGRGGRQEQATRQGGGRRQNAKQALKKTEDEFPTL